MQLKSIELTGFKSFAKKSLLEFKTPITSVVGPNGSGKSNVAEAIRFVLGEQSMKSMRGKKGEDLIWNGAQSEPRANRAAVKLVFDNTDKAFNLDFPEVMVERVVNRDGSNEYKLNGSTVRLKDIFELLSSASLGSSGHHIISQGEADKILNASTRERKSIVEDALGLKLYQYKREESERKLEKTRENIAQVEALRKEIAPHLRYLKKQMDQIEKTENMREELVRLARTYFAHEELYLAEEAQDIAGLEKPITDSLKKLKEELAEAKDVLENSGKEDKKEFLVLEVEKEIAEVRARRDDLHRELGRVEGALSLQEEILKKEQELSASEENKMIRLQDVESLYTEVSLLTTLQEVVARIKTFIQDKKHSVDSSKALEAEKQITSLKEEEAQARALLQKVEGEESKLEENYEDLKKQIDQSKDSGRDAEKAVFRIMSEENALHGDRKVLEGRTERLKLEEAEFKRELTEVGHLVGVEAIKYEKFSGPLGEREVQDEQKRELSRLKIRLEDSGVSGAGEVEREFRDTSERDEFLAKELVDLDKSAEALKELIQDLGDRLATEFKNGLDKINKEFSIFFHDMFGGGEAELILTKEVSKQVEFEDEEPDQVEEGLDISVSLPRKKVRSLMMLSGGERALTSIALIFAVSQVNPPPFIILDETDAALDEANSKKYGDMIERLAKHSQLILITHNRETMSRAGVIYGVTMNSTGVSRLLSIEFEEAVQVAK